MEENPSKFLGLSAITQRRLWSIGFVSAVIGAFWRSDWLRPTGPVICVEPMRRFNIALTLILAGTGPGQWARNSLRYDHIIMASPHGFYLDSPPCWPFVHPSHRALGPCLRNGE